MTRWSAITPDPPQLLRARLRLALHGSGGNDLNRLVHHERGRYYNSKVPICRYLGKPLTDRTVDPLLTIEVQGREARARQGHRKHEDPANWKDLKARPNPRRARGLVDVRTSFARDVGCAGTTRTWCDSHSRASSAQTPRAYSCGGNIRRPAHRLGDQRNPLTGSHRCTHRNREMSHDSHILSSPVCGSRLVKGARDGHTWDRTLLQISKYRVPRSAPGPAHSRTSCADSFARGQATSGVTGRERGRQQGSRIVVLASGAGV